jgi:hypothetical protein
MYQQAVVRQIKRPEVMPPISGGTNITIRLYLGAILEGK